MEQTEALKPIDLEWLVTSLPRDRSDSRTHLEIFWRNVLYYPPKGSWDKHHKSILNIMKENPDADFKDNDTTMTIGGAVTYSQALIACERARQLYYCNTKLYVQLARCLVDNFVHMCRAIPQDKKVKGDFLNEFKKSIQESKSEILKGVQRDTRKIEILKDYTRGVGAWKANYRGLAPDNTPCNKFYWLLDIINLRNPDQATIEMIMEEGSTLERLVTAICGLEAIWGRMSNSKMPCVNPRWKLFCTQLYLSPHSQMTVTLDRRSVVSTAQAENGVYDLYIMPTVGASNKYKCYARNDWQGTGNIGTRLNDMKVFMAYNLFDTAVKWLRTWGEPPDPVTLATLSSYADLDRLVPNLRDEFADQADKTVLITVPQFAQMCKELTGTRPDFRADNSVDPVTNTNPSVPKESVARPEAGEEDIVGTAEEGSAGKGGLEPPDEDEDAVARAVRKTYPQRVTTIPQTEEQKKAAQKEADGNWMLAALAILGLVAFNMS